MDVVRKKLKVLLESEVQMLDKDDRYLVVTRKVYKVWYDVWSSYLYIILSIVCLNEQIAISIQSMFLQVSLLK